MNKGFFITIEGLDGSGKTTVTQKINNYLTSLINNKQINFAGVALTREPGNKDIPICNEIREIILKHSDIDTKSSVLLFSANRNEHLLKFIIPNLNENKIVLSDRFVDSSLAYQTYGNNLFDYVWETNKSIIGDWMPNITFYLDVNYETSNYRVRIRDNNNHFDFKTKEYFDGIRNNFLMLANKFNNRIKVINANLSEQEVFEAIKNELNKCLLIK